MNKIPKISGVSNAGGKIKDLVFSLPLGEMYTIARVCGTW